MPRVHYKGNAAAATLSTAMTAGATQMAVPTTATAKWPTLYPYVLTIDRGLASLEEKVLVTALLSSGGGTNTYTVTRGHDDTAASAHDAGARVEHTIDANSLTEFAQHVYAENDAGKLAHITSMSPVDGSAPESAYPLGQSYMLLTTSNTGYPYPNTPLVAFVITDKQSINTLTQRWIYRGAGANTAQDTRIWERRWLPTAGIWGDWAQVYPPIPVARSRRIMALYKNAGLTTFTAVGMPSPTIGAITSADDAGGPWGQFATAATSGNANGIISAFNVVRRDWSDPEFSCRIKGPGNITTIRLIIGVAAANIDALGPAPNNVAGAYFYFDTAYGHTNWQCVVSNGDGSASATQTIDSGVAVGASTNYEMRINLNASDVQFFINDVLVATHTAQLPPATTSMGYMARVITQSAAARNLRVGRMTLVHV